MAGASRAQVRESLRGATIDVKVSEHPMQARVQAAQGALADLRRRLPGLQGRERGMGHRDASRLRADVKALRAEMMSLVGKGGAAGGKVLASRRGCGRSQRRRACCAD
jgi:hypothetical protein